MKKLLYLFAFILPLTLLAQDTKQYKHSIPLSGAKQGTIKLEIPAGELTLQTGSNQLLDANIRYHRAGWEPILNLNRNDKTARIALKQKEVGNKENSGENKWTVNLNKDLPLNLHLTLGAGTSTLNLSNSQIQKLNIGAGAVSCDVNLKGSAIKVVEIAAGVGELNVDMTGNWNYDVQVEIAGGIGEVNMKLPKNAGVRLNATGLGSKNLSSFKKNGSQYQNAAFGKSKHTLTINVSGGMGTINVVEG